MMENIACHPLPPFESPGHRPGCPVPLAHKILLIFTVAGTALFAVACGGSRLASCSASHIQWTCSRLVPCALTSKWVLES